MQNFLRQADVQPPKIIIIIMYTYTFTLKIIPQIKHFRLQNAKFYCKQGGMQPPKFMNTYKFRLKRAWNELFYLTRYKIFL